MNTLIKALTENLKMLGYNETIINSVISKFDAPLSESKLEDVENYSDYIEVYQYEEPTVEIIRAFLNINQNFIQTEILEGDIEAISIENALRGRFVGANYFLDKRCALISLENDYKIKINIYSPTQKTQIIYAGKTYEDIYKRDRNEVTSEYKEAFVKNKRLQERKIDEILSMLISDYIIDEMIVQDINPRLKMYDDPIKYAENITTYSLRFINSRTNRIEIFEKEPSIRRLGKGVTAGTCNNDPYIRLSEMPEETNFFLNRISYYWLSDNGKRQEEIAIYTAIKEMPQETFIEMKKNSMIVNMAINDVNKMLKRMQSIEEDYSGYISKVIKSLNMELVNPSIQIIKEGLDNQDLIIPITYKYRFTTNPREYEEKLYVSIEDNIGRDYKYKISETVFDDSTRIGTKLEYTNDKNELVKRQSIADFNVNAPTAILRKETFINEKRIQDLLGYIYEDMEDYGTDKLPIPSVYVEIYIPPNQLSSVSMYNGTSLDPAIDKSKNNILYFKDGEDDTFISYEDAIPGSTYVTVKYVNSKDEVLKENKIGNLLPNTTFLPEMLPIINDATGKEWRAELTRLEPYIVKENPELNVIKLKYIEKYTRVTLSFINREGKKIAEDKQEIIQVGETYNFDSKNNFKTKDDEEWKLKLARPSKFIAKDDEEKNKIILVYDIERTDLVIKYVNKNTNEEIIESRSSVVAANKKYAIDVPKFILDSNGLGWNYIEGGNTNILAEKDIVNEVVLYYTEAKVPVTVRFKDENNISLIDDKVELIQIGKKYSYTYDNFLSDFSCREWKLKNNTSKEFVVNKEREQNIIEGIYEPVLANVSIRFINTDNRPIKNDEIESAQIGEIFNAESKDEIIDNFGKAWKCISSGEKIVVTSKEIENQIVLKYEPLMSKVKINYLDIEMNQLMEPKYETLQVGTTYKNRPIEKFTSKDGKHWKIDYDKIESFVVKKHEEENIYTIYYDKEMAKVKLSFFDAYNNELKDEQEIESQIGAVVETKIFGRITDKNGERWMLETSEPKNLVAKENNNFIKLIYGEIKAKVLVKYIDVTTQKPIVENLLTTVKLGGIYIPNIQPRILDKNKYLWKYIGDENISIVTKENEQENIIILNYEEDRAKVILKYLNTENEKIREDVSKDVQIGKEIRIEPKQRFSDSNGLLWKYNSMKMENKLVEDKDNIINLTYEPFMSEIKIKYVDENGTSLIADKILSVQVGKEFVPEILDRVISNDKKTWIYNKISEEKIIVKESQNEIVMTFMKLMNNVIVQYVGEEDENIAETKIYNKQVGEFFEIPYEKAYQDKEEKAWLLVKAEKENIITSEQEENNIVKIRFRKELVDLKLKYYNDAKQIIRAETMEKAQIGSIYRALPFDEIIDEKTKLGWKLPDNFNLEFKVKRNPEENVLNIGYEKLKVKIDVRYKDAYGNDIIEKKVYEEQVGQKFLPEIEQEVIDSQDREWKYGLEEEGRLFATGKNKIDPITVARDESKNFIDLKYRPSLIKVTIKYVEPLGTSIKPDLIVDAQIGSIFEAEIIEVLQDSKKVKWVYNPNSKSSMKVGRDEKTNIIILAYEEEKALVTYKYQDEYGNRLRTPKRKLVQIGSTHIPEVENIIEDFEGKVWEYKAKSIDKLEIKEDESSNVIEMIYAPLYVETVLQFNNMHSKQIAKEMVVKAQLGSVFSPDIQEKITDEDSKLFKFVKCSPESIKIEEVPIGALKSPNTFELTYEPVYSNAIIKYQTIDGEKIKEDDITQIQVGTIYEIPVAQFIKDENGIEWELISKEDINSIRIKEDERENVVKMVYEIAKTEVTIRYLDLVGNEIYRPDIIQIEVGKEFIPEIKHELIDENNKKWTFQVAEPVKLTVGSINNIIKITYQEKKATVIVKYLTQDGRTLKEDYKTKVQIGTKYDPQNIMKVMYEGAEVWRFAYNEPSVLVVSENLSENVIAQIYTKEERRVENNNEKKPYYNPEIEKFIDKNLVEADVQENLESERISDQEYATLQESEITEEPREENKVLFEDKNLKILENSIALTDEEKTAINKLNGLNDEIIEKLNDAINEKEKVDYIKLEILLNEKMTEEKKIVEENLMKFISQDKTGRKLLKIFEAITASEASDKNFSVLQQRKAVSIADYFINEQISENEQAIYICNKGIVEKAIECLDEKIKAGPILDKKNRIVEDNREEYLKFKIVLLYEKAILNNYYKARSKVKDEYFKNSSSKELIPPEIAVLVANILPKQAYKLLEKNISLSLIKENELDAILKLMNTQQIGTLMLMVEKIQDGKIRKNAIRRIKEIVG